MLPFQVLSIYHQCEKILTFEIVLVTTPNNAEL